MTTTPSRDARTAEAFATSWNNLPGGSVYTQDQFEDWFAPIGREDVAGKRVLELGCGNASLMVRMASWEPALLTGVDLGDSVRSATANMKAAAPGGAWEVLQGDLTTFRAASPGDGYDLVYCIGVLHHLKDPHVGFESVLENTAPGGRFHCWVYAREGNGIIVHVVDPIRGVTSRLPWWLTKYGVATPLVVPYYLYAKLLAALPRAPFLKKLPLYEYSLWIAKRGFDFFRHVAFDQLVTPQTTYIHRDTVEQWLRDPRIEPGSSYVIMRNGNSWKFGGRRA